MSFTTIPTRTILDPNSSTDVNSLMANDTFNKGRLGFMISGALTTASAITDVTIPFAMELGNILFDVGTAVATADMTIDVFYGANPASKHTLYDTTKPKIVNGAFTSTDGVLTSTTLSARGHLNIQLSGTFTAATDLTIWLIPA